MRLASAVRTIAVVICIALLFPLWTYWASICNEACAPQRALLMQLLSIGIPASIVFAVFAASEPLPSSLRRHASRVLVAVLLILGAYVTFAE